MSTIKVSNIQHGSAASAAITLDANGQATLNGLAFPTSGSLSGRNRIINGDMRIDQRNAGASVTASVATANTYTLDRWYYYGEQASKFSVQQVADAPAGFINSLKATSLSAYTLLAGDIFSISQKIEGFNFSDLGFGTASAQTVTLTFRVKSSLTGTFGGCLQNQNQDKSYPFSYIINSANTWETKSITISGETTGTWQTGSDPAARITFALGAGSNNQGPANAWISSGPVSVPGATSVVGTNGATLYITGVQLEAGSVATPFERRSYGQELALCQRYFLSYGGNSAYERIAMGTSQLTTNAIAVVHFPVQMRTSPTLSYSDLGHWAVELPGLTAETLTSLSIDTVGLKTAALNCGFSSNANLGSYKACCVYATNTTSARMLFSAEL